ncbi:hypothetical protein TRFO_15120 [Tritrichomonas foetus]|uniref:Ubiquitin-like domain-containing protein n=1 Tax=Tritrichomonas foetus TaxID=1144522 RepID=A0A1J4KY27_9EUKA|nr:hypothetical protein TRFO_15120 [Tritrichomonas foetus]|eukprot:OHT14469.1 hypothetical protein TRFO_15120 [Tritrichomonas foetus]
MKIQVEFTKDGEKQIKDIYCDDAIDCQELKQLCCCAAFSSPALTKIFFNGKLLLGKELLYELGIQEGTVIQLETASL